MLTQEQKINNYIKNCTETECEFRFGSYEKGKWSPGLTKEQFDKIFIFVKSFAEYKHSTDENTIDLVSDVSRQRLFIEGDSFKPYTEAQIIKKVTIEKQKIENVNLIDKNVRFSVSNEIATDSVGVPSYFKAMKRYSFYYAEFRIDTSIQLESDSLETLYSKEPKFDIEIEVLSPVSVENCFKFIDCIREKIVVNNEAVKIYQMILKQQHYFGSQSIPLREYLIDTKKEYSVSLKLDGIRVLLIVILDKVFFINSKFHSNILDLSLKNEAFDGTILDTEYKDGVYHIFDCIAFKNKDLRKTKGIFLKKRLEFVEDFLKNLGGNVITLKKHLFGDIHQNSMKLLKNAVSEDYDGLIFTPVNECYPLNSRSPGVPLKWKAPSSNTIDFRLKSDSENRMQLLVNSDKGEVLFEVEDYPGIGYLTECPKELCGKIFECAFSKKENRFELVKERSDKSKPNYITIALDNFELNIDPFDFDSLSKKRNNTYFFNMRRFHNWIKRVVLDKYTIANGENGHLDLACGKGGDIFKYFDNSIRHVSGYDISEQSIISAVKRFSNSNSDPIHKNFDYSFFVKDLSVESIGNSKQFDSGSCFFAIHYFFKNEESLDNLIKNMSSLKDGAHFMVSCFCGDRLKEQDYNVTTKKFRITKKEVDSSKIYGNSVDVFLEDTVLNVPTTEYIVDIKVLIKKMKDSGFEIVSNKYFEEYYEEWSKNDNYLNNISKKFSFLNKMLVFRKTKELDWNLVDESVVSMDYNSKTVPELKVMCKNRGIKIPAKIKKNELISLLN
jgi:mRNA (guanine-N7-)-methyltransferase